MLVKQRLRLRERRSTAKGKAWAGGNSSSNDLINVLRNAFESNWYGASSTRSRTKKRTKKPAKDTVIVVDEEDDEEQGQEKSKVPMPLDRAMAKTFTYNSANPNVAAFASAPDPPVASGSTHQLRKKARAETLSDTESVEVHITSPTKRSRTLSNPGGLELGPQLLDIVASCIAA